VLLRDGFSGKQLCVKALALKKAAAIKGFDKVRCMIEYANVKRLISGDSTLYPYAQAIGALPMTNPSKQRLRDLCRKYNIPQAWYYVSQVENLYGMNYSLGKLSFCPSVAADNILEQLAVTVDGKHINTTFARSSVQSMTLNGVYSLPTVLSVGTAKYRQHVGSDVLAMAFGNGKFFRCMVSAYRLTPPQTATTPHQNTPSNTFLQSSNTQKKKTITSGKIRLRPSFFLQYSACNDVAERAILYACRNNINY